MEIALGPKTSVFINGSGPLVFMKVTRPEGERIYKIQDRVPYELIGGQWVYLTDRGLGEEDDTPMRKLTSRITNQLPELGYLEQMFFFDAIFTDLIEGKPLDWVPQGHIYLELEGPPVFLVFNSKEDLMKHKLDSLAQEDPNIDLTGQPGWDPEEGFGEIPYQEYYSSAEHDVREKFRSQH